MKVSRKLGGWWLALTLVPGALFGQGRGGSDPATAYLRAVGEHFRVPSQEVAVLSEWGLPLEEIPVVLFLARRGGLSADALVTLKRGGQSWALLAERCGLDGADFHVDLAESAGAGPLASAYAKYRGAGGDLAGVLLDDREIVGLVNLRFLSEFSRVPPARVLETAGASASWVLAYGSLAPR